MNNAEAENLGNGKKHKLGLFTGFRHAKQARLNLQYILSRQAAVPEPGYITVHLRSPRLIIALSTRIHHGLLGYVSFEAPSCTARPQHPSGQHDFFHAVTCKMPVCIITVPGRHPTRSHSAQYFRRVYA